MNFYTVEVHHHSHPCIILPFPATFSPAADVESYNRNTLLSLLIPHSYTRPYFQQPASLPHLLNSHKPRHASLCTSCASWQRRYSLPPSHFTSHLPCRGGLWTCKCKYCHWLNFWIPAGFKWHGVPQVRLGAFALNIFVLRSLLRWWKNSFMVLITAGMSLPGMICPCVSGINPAIWTVGKRAGIALFLDVVWAFLCYKIVFIVWGFVTHHVAFCDNFDFCVDLNPL